jgi:hypothetical protein
VLKMLNLCRVGVGEHLVVVWKAKMSKKSKGITRIENNGRSDDYRHSVVTCAGWLGRHVP